MAKSESINNHRLTARVNFIVLCSTHNWVDGMKFIAQATIPDILPIHRWAEHNQILRHVLM